MGLRGVFFPIFVSALEGGYSNLAASNSSIIMYFLFRQFPSGIILLSFPRTVLNSIAGYGNSKLTLVRNDIIR